MTSTTASNVTLELAPPEKSNMVKNNKSIGTSNAVVFIACLVPSFVAVAAIGVAAAAWSRVNELKSTHLDTIITPAATAPDGYSMVSSLLTGTGTWAATSDMPVAKSDLQSISCLNKETRLLEVVLLGGLDAAGDVVGDVYTFDPVNEVYSAPLTPMPTPRYRFGAACKDGKVWVAGGFNNSHAGNMGWSIDSVDIYDVATDTWTSGPALNTARGDLALANFGGDLYAMGGYDWSYTALASVEKLADGATSWTAAASMSSPKGDLQAAVIDGMVYVPGGWNAGSTFLSELDVYDPSADSWSLGPSMDAPRGDTAVVALDGKVFVIGGEMWSGVMSTCDWGWGPEECAVNLIPMHGVEMFDPATQVWTSMAPLPASRFRFAAAAVEGRHAEGALYAFGGHAHGEVAVTSVWNFHYVPRPNFFIHTKDA